MNAALRAQQAHRELEAACYPEFSKGVAEMKADCGPGDFETLRDIFIAEPIDDAARNLPLLYGQGPEDSIPSQHPARPIRPLL